MVDAHWIASNPELALERMRAHHEHGRMLFAEAVAKHPTFYDTADIPGFDEEERDRLDAMFGKYGAKSWTTLNLHDRVAEIEGHWKGEAVKTLRFFLDIVHRENNQTLHVSARGLTDIVRAHDETGLTLKLGPGGEMLDRSLFGAYWLFAQTAGLIFDHFEFPVDTETRADVFSDADFAQIEPDDLRGVGRNDLCPCGSGKKFKRCHGA